ncbi:hypothetical protein CEXT_105731 [Caerostris extrusa]|uniref:Uncharacterized protein n=1 Tax=Caerostris extrusa TaxID=172846 RepID=A0AAV4P7A7_CAEEX|nr:hypothetical protein CEXT_105731 [Caerostris extrusa]
MPVKANISRIWGLSGIWGEELDEPQDQKKKIYLSLSWQLYASGKSRLTHCDWWIGDGRGGFKEIKLITGQFQNGNIPWDRVNGSDVHF